MDSRRTDKSLDIASFSGLVATLTLSVPLVERLTAAAWQWYKFIGYSNAGSISLSLNIGFVYSGLLAVLFGSSFWLSRTARQRSATRSERCLSWAMHLAAANAVGYWLLGVSGLNVWRA